MVLRWAARQGRDLPWRHTRDPWAILVSEVMAQQTQVHRVMPKWWAFLERWPSPSDCAAASLGDVLRLWEGLGYPRRARNLHACALAIETLGSFPDSLDGLLALPGVGPYTARAVLAFAFERDVAVVDTNVARVLARHAGRRLTTSEVQAAADAAVPEGAGWAWNQALLDLGATVCTARRPTCHACPLSDTCAYYRGGAVPTNDPAVGSALVSGTQAPFRGSDRQVRGRLLRAMAGGALSADRVAAAAEIPLDPQRAHTLMAALVAEGLAAEEDGSFRLP